MNIKSVPYFEVLNKILNKKKQKKKLQICSLYNFNPLVLENYIRYFLLEKNINVDFLKNEYDQIDQTLLSSKFNNNLKNTRILIIGSDINKKISYNHDLLDHYIESLKMNLENLFSKKRSNLNDLDVIFFNCTTLVSGNYASKGTFKIIQKKIEKFNNYLEKLSTKIKNLHILNIDNMSRIIGMNQFYDETNFFISKVPYTELANTVMSFEISKIINSILTVRKKCLVLDLDNTLWGGVLGEEGVGGIDLGKTLNGENFKNFQRYLKILQQRGVILAISSKNNLKDVQECFKKNEDMILKFSDFSSFQINWNEKYLNVNAIAKELNIGKDSIVFFDDSEFEREQMIKFNPEITTLDFPKESKYLTKTIEDSMCFYQNKETSEDKKKKYQYEILRKVNNAKLKSENVDQFLKNLSMKLEISLINENNFDRSVQLIHKTNQFNLTTKRYSSSELKSYIKSKNQISLVARLKDKFGDHGITALVMAKKKDNNLWIIDNFLLSCRIFGRGVENLILTELLKKLKQKNVKKVEGIFFQSDKNLMCKNFYLNNEFKKKKNNFLFELKNFKNKNKANIKVKYIK